MKVSINWFKELVDLKIPIEELVKLLPLRTIGLKEVTSEYLELDMKGYNRADLLSLRGVAYEVAAITDSKVEFDEESEFIWQNNNLPEASVKVNNNDLAPLYCIAKIENLKVEHSDDTWVKKLNDSGIRSVNNIADVTNLMMIEYGQPMHAFDASQVDNETIIVRTAKDGEGLITLDGKIRVLTSEDLLITDPQKALGLAGVMGGKNSEVTENTSSILLEAAIFDPKTLRKTSTKLGLVSEASKRFYHGLTKQRLFQALNKAIKMYEEIGGKLTALTIVDSSEKNNPVVLNLTQDKINSLIGVDISPQAVEDYLSKLQFKLKKNNEDWKVTPPYFRLDIEIEEDLIEEIARMYGYEKIPAQPLNTNIPKIPQNLLFGLLERLKNTLSQTGLTEVQTYSYYSTEVLNNLALNKDNLIKIANPISAETEYLRENLWPNLLEITAKNIRNGIKDVAIFEIGKVYKIENNLPKESYHLSIALSNNTTNPIQELNQLAQDLNLSLKNQLTGEYFHPNRHIEGIAEVHPRIVNKFKVEQKIAVLEAELTELQ